MSRDNAPLAPGYVRLSGEIADQAVLDALKARFPRAAIGHAYASTEAGVGFEVNDGLEGFPTRFVDQQSGEVEMRVVDGSLRLRSQADGDGIPQRRSAAAGRRRGVRRLRRHGRAARRPLPFRRPPRRHHQCRRPEGFARGGRGGNQPSPRRAGGLGQGPAQPDHRRDRRGRGRARPMRPTTRPRSRPRSCRPVAAICAPHKVPAGLRFVPALAMTAGGKLERVGA